MIDALRVNNPIIGSAVVECLTRDRGAVVSNHTGVTVLCPNPSLVLIQPRKTRPFITERLFMGRKQSNQTNKILLYLSWCFEAQANIFGISQVPLAL